MSLDDMRRELRRRYERIRKREEERRKTMLRYYEPITSSSNPDEKKPTRLESTRAIVDMMDSATLWRWKTAIDERLEREKKEYEFLKARFK